MQKGQVLFMIDIFPLVNEFNFRHCRKFGWVKSAGYFSCPDLQSMGLLRRAG
jgi:hypothetical protein